MCDGRSHVSCQESRTVPDSRSERIFFAAGLAAIVGLVLWLIPAVRHYQRAAPDAAPSLVRTSAPARAEQTAYQPPETRKAGPAQPVSEPRRAAPLAPPAARPETPALKVTLAAPRGDCWVEVRELTSDGKVLYSGTLEQGDSFRAAVERLWIRFGAPQNVNLVLNGKPAPIPTGTLNVIVTRAGVESVA